MAGSRRKYVISGAVLAVVVVFALPYLWIVSSGFKGQTEIFKDMSPVSWRTFFPVNAVTDNFVELFVQKGVGLALGNSLAIAAIEVLGALVVCSMAAYALTRMKFRGARGDLRADPRHLHAPC